jgi:hypothetical protein
VNFIPIAAFSLSILISPVIGESGHADEACRLIVCSGVLFAFIGHLEMRLFGGHRRKTSWQDGLDRQVLRATIFFWNANLRSKDSRDAPACKS